MARIYNLSSSFVFLANRLHARVLGFSKPATAFIRQTEPRSIGSYPRGLQLKAGNILLAGHLMEAPGLILWDVPPPSLGFLYEAHGFGWLDDLASVGDQEARKIAQVWVQTWIVRFGRGAGPGWMPHSTGRRIIRWIHHGFMILRGAESDSSKLFFQSLGRQTLFLSRRWFATPIGLPRFEALAGLIYAGLTLEGMEEHVRPATSALARECINQIDENGSIPTRNPEELLEVFTLLNWVADALEIAGWTPSRAHLNALKRIAPTLRMLRHKDGSLARFHGGGKGIEGRLDEALAQSGNKKLSISNSAMGFGRLSSGRTSIIIDAAPPPKGRFAPNAHASTLAIELTSGQMPLFVSSGSGARFGQDWERSGRRTESHSTVTISGFSSARFDKRMLCVNNTNEALVGGPDNVPFNFSYEKKSTLFEAGHNGYVSALGLTHVRRLNLSHTGNTLMGEDMLLALEQKDRRLFEIMLDRLGWEGIDYQVRFHIHPDVLLTLDMGGMAVSMKLKNGETWVFRHSSKAELSIKPSTYFDSSRLKPRVSNQIVLSHKAIEHASSIRWSLINAWETELGPSRQKEL